jgi:hypothetical protein
MFADLDKLPLSLQVMALVGAAVIGALVYLRSLKAPPAPQSSVLDDQFRHIRADFYTAIESLRTSFNDQINDLREQVNDLHTRVAVLYDRHDRAGRR